MTVLDGVKEKLRYREEEKENLIKEYQEEVKNCMKLCEEALYNPSNVTFVHQKTEMMIKLRERLSGLEAQINTLKCIANLENR